MCAQHVSTAGKQAGAGVLGLPALTPPLTTSQPLWRRTSFLASIRIGKAAEIEMCTCPPHLHQGLFYCCLEGQRNSPKILKMWVLLVPSL